MRYSSFVSSPRVASWVYAVVNVYIDAFTAEAVFLQRGNATWRFYNRQLEHIRPSTAYLSHNGLHILRDMAREQSEVEARLHQHDALRMELQDVASRTFDVLVGNVILKSTVEDAMKHYRLREPNAKPTGAFPAEKMIDLVAEHLINSIQDLPTHHTDSDFWRLYRDQFAAVSVDMKELANSKTTFLHFVQATRSWLEDLSLELCRKYDIPAAPSGSIAL